MYIAAAVAASLGQFSDVNKVPIVRAEELSEPYESMERAVEAALKQASPHTIKSRHEYGGMVLKNAEGYRHTLPVTSEDTHSVRYRMTIPKDHLPAAIYHTHPCGPQSQLYSRDDMQAVKQLGVPSYIADMCTHNSYVVLPKDVSKNPRRGTPVPTINLRGKPHMSPEQEQVEVLKQLSKPVPTPVESNFAAMPRQLTELSQPLSDKPK